MKLAGPGTAPYTTSTCTRSPGVSGHHVMCFHSSQWSPTSGDGNFWDQQSKMLVGCLIVQKVVLFSVGLHHLETFRRSFLPARWPPLRLPLAGRPAQLAGKHEAIKLLAKTINSKALLTLPHSFQSTAERALGSTKYMSLPENLDRHTSLKWHARDLSIKGPNLPSMFDVQRCQDCSDCWPCAQCRGGTHQGRRASCMHEVTWTPDLLPCSTLAVHHYRRSMHAHLSHDR